jgi:hypothetical protein
MRVLCAMALTISCLMVSLPVLAQRQGRGGQAANRASGGESLASRMMRFDKDGDGKLTRDEVTDERLQRLYDRADADKDGVVTKDELTALASREQQNNRGGPPGFGPGGPPPDGGPGGPRMMGPPPRPGEIMPSMMRQRLNLTSKQEKQLADLQKDVDARLSKILSSAQQRQLKQMRERGPGGFGPPPGDRGPGGPPSFGPDGPSGPPPDDEL